MKVQIISFNCILKNKTGQLISNTFNREVLAAEQIEGSPLNALARQLQNLVKGEKRQISLTAQEAYGFYDPAKIILFPKRKLPKHIRTGETLQIVGKSGQVRSYKVVQLHHDMASLDGNHPLAGQDLIFEIDVVSARDASVEEIRDSANPMSVQQLH